MRSERLRMGIVVCVAAQAALGLAAVTMAGCAPEPRVCYETVEHPEFGRVLKRTPCPADGEEP